MHTCDFMYLDSAEFIIQSRRVSSSARVLGGWHWRGVLVLGGSGRLRAANTLCGWGGSRPNPNIQCDTGHLSSAAHPDPASFPPNAPVLSGFQLLPALFQQSKWVSVSLNIKAFVSPQRGAEASCGCSSVWGRPLFHRAPSCAEGWFGSMAAEQGPGGALAGAELPLSSPSHSRVSRPCPKGSAAARVDGRMGPAGLSHSSQRSCQAPFWLLFVSIASQGLLFSSSLQRVPPLLC